MSPHDSGSAPARDVPGLFDIYPTAPGWRARETSRAAAAGIARVAGPLRERVLEAIRAQPDTPEGVAERLKVPLMNVRPRLSELSRLQLVKDSGVRGKAQGGRRAIVWRAA